MELEELLTRFQRGDRRALARAISWVENGAPESAGLIRATYPQTGRAHVVGITGPPGAGKSTLVDRLAGQYRRMGRSVGIIAVDPTSPFTGGAILGDRIRMQRTLADPGVFMRSLASRGHLGGISLATGDVVGLMDAFGFAVVLVETVGAGQSEVEIMGLAHTTCVVLIPGMGDDIQAIKAGILEIGDLFAVNKADRDGADRAVTEIEMMLDLGHMGEGGINRWAQKQAQPPPQAALDRLDRTGHHSADQIAGAGAGMTVAARHAAQRHGSASPGDISWRPPVVRTVAKDGQGTDSLLARLEEHLAFLRETGRWEQLKRQDAVARLREIIRLQASQKVLQRAAELGDLQRLSAEVAERTTDPYSAAEQILTRHMP